MVPPKATWSLAEFDCTLTSDLMGPCECVGTPGPSSLDSGGFSNFADESQILFLEAQL